MNGKSKPRCCLRRLFALAVAACAMLAIYGEARASKSSSAWGVWAYQPGGGDWDPCRIHYVAARRPNARYDNRRNGYVLVRTAATRAAAGKYLRAFSRYHDDLPDKVIKLRSCKPRNEPGGTRRGSAGGGGVRRPLTTGPGGRPSLMGSRYGLWAYNVGAGAAWSNPCRIHYVLARIDSRYRNRTGYRLVATSKYRGNLERLHRAFSPNYNDQPDGKVKTRSCRAHRKRLHDERLKAAAWLACLRRAEKKYPRSSMDCNGSWLTGSRASHIRDTERKLRDLDKASR